MQVTRLLLFACFSVSCLLAQRDAGIAAFNSGHYSEALKDLSAADKNDQQAQLFLALTQAAVGDCEAALPALAKQNSDVLAGIAAVKCYALVGDKSAEFSALQRLEQANPNNADVLYLVAKEHMQAFNDATFELFQKTPSSFRVHELSAEIFEVENRYSEAIVEYRKAIELNPQAPDLHFRLGRALLLENHGTEALNAAAREFDAELKLSPEDASCQFQLGQIAQVQAHTADAKRYFERAIELRPDFVQALVSLGKIEISEKDFARAIEHLNRAAQLQPNSESAHYALLTAYRDSGNLEKAKTEKQVLDNLQKPQSDEFTEFLKKLGQKSTQQ